MQTHEGGCLCGEVRFRVEGEPERAAICHCRYCQLRTGSAFGVSVYVPLDQVTRLSGDLQEFSFRSESGNTWLIERCSSCGTGVYWTIDAEPWASLQGISGGCFDPPSFWYPIRREVFARTRADFCSIEVNESHDTHPAHAPLEPDRGRLSWKA